MSKFDAAVIAQQDICFAWCSIGNHIVFLQGPFTPKRYYSIDRVFRNEAVDRTHLAEFHQIEGVYFWIFMSNFMYKQSDLINHVLHFGANIILSQNVTSTDSVF